MAAVKGLSCRWPDLHTHEHAARSIPLLTPALGLKAGLLYLRSILPMPPTASDNVLNSLAAFVDDEPHLEPLCWLLRRAKPAVSALRRGVSRASPVATECSWHQKLM